MAHRAVSPHPAARSLPHTAPLRRTEGTLERGRGRGQRGRGGHCPSPKAWTGFGEQVPGQHLLLLPALPGLDAEGLSRGHRVTPRPGPSPGPQVRRSTRCSPPSQSRARGGLASGERTRRSALPSQTASKTTSSSVFSKHSLCQAGHCTWIHNSFRQRPLLTGPAWVTRHASFCLPLATPHSLRDPRTRGGTAPSAATGPNKRPPGILTGRAS